VGFGNIVREDGGVEFRLLPLSRFQGFREFFAVDADLHGKRPLASSFVLPNLVTAACIRGKPSNGKRPYFSKKYEVIVAFSGCFHAGVERVGDVLRQRIAIDIEKRTDLGVRRQSVDGFVNDEPVAAPAHANELCGSNRPR